MPSVESIADARQASLIGLSEKLATRGRRAWNQVDFAALDASWAVVAPALALSLNAAQGQAAAGSDRYVSRLSTEYDLDEEPTSLVPQAFAGVDGSGRGIETGLYGAVAAAKEAVRAGLGAREAMLSGATYLATMLKTALADQARSSDMVASVGRGYVQYIRTVEPGACARCMALAGSDRFSKQFQRHPACRCTTRPIPLEEARERDYKGPNDLFEELSPAEQDRRFGKAGAQAIRDGADLGQVVNARRGMGRPKSYADYSRMTKTTIGRRPDGTPVRVYATSEGTTSRGGFGRREENRVRLAGARYTSARRVRLMPESILEIAGDDQALRQAFLRDAGYLEYKPNGGYDLAAIAEQRKQDRILVNRATIRYGNFTLGN